MSIINEIKAWISDVNGQHLKTKPTNSIETPLFTNQVFKGTNISVAALFELVGTNGFLDGETYDEIDFGVNSQQLNILTFVNVGINQFQITINLISENQFTIKKRAAEFPMLQENGDFMLLETGDKILIEGLVP